MPHLNDRTEREPAAAAVHARVWVLDCTILLCKNASIELEGVIIEQCITVQNRIS